jgi:hypothetical protein
MSVSQNHKIISRLKQANGDWVSLPDLWKASGAFAVPTRVSDCRKAGYEIENRIETTPDGTKNSFYRLIA